MYLTCLIVLILAFSQIYSKKSSMHLKEKSKSNKADSPANQIYKTENSLGHSVKRDSILTKFPMKVKSCDQIAIFQAKYITDFADYRSRADGWYTVSAYSINLYKDKDANKLIHSVMISNLKTKPQHLKGAKGCISVDGGNISADITVCFDSKNTADNLLNVINSFYKCRRGDNLQPIPKKLVRQLLQLCGKNGKALYNKDKKDFIMNSKGRAGNKWDADRMRYYHPLPITVPGTG